MKTTFILVITILLFGCATAIPPQSATSVSSDRKFAFSDSSPEKAKIVITRDSGTGLCDLDLSIDGVLSATYQVEETAEFYLSPGEHDISVGFHPTGICSIAKSGHNPSAVETILKPSETKFFRITIEFSTGPVIRKSVK